MSGSIPGFGMKPARRRRSAGAPAVGEQAVSSHVPSEERLVLDWNVSAQAFYRALGAAPTAGWDRWRLEGDGLAGLARSADPGGNSSNRLL